MPDKYFAKFDGGRFERIAFLQMDLTKHSNWFQRCLDEGVAVRATRAKVELVKAITKSLASLRLHPLYWAGDGGMFVATASGVPNYDFIVAAADRVFGVFLPWRRNNRRLLTESLDIRVSAHVTDVFAYSNAWFWTSAGLNWFAKNEREIAVAGGFVITNDVRRSLNERRFTKRFQVKLGPSTYESAYQVDRFIDSKRKPKTGANFPLSRFLQNLRTSLGLPNESEIGPSTQFRARIGDALLLEGATAPDAGLNIDYRKVGEPLTVDLSPSEREEWEARAEQTATDFQREPKGKGDLWKVCPTHIIFPLKDFPLVTIDWRPDRFSRLVSFYRFITDPKNQATRLRLASEALNPVRSVPSVFVSHCVVLTRPEKWEGYGDVPRIILSERNKNPGEVAYVPGVWSASFEEQVQVQGEGSEQRAELPEDCITRGLEEEFGVKLRERPAVLGIVVERPHFNLGFLGLIQLSLSYQEIEEGWLHAADKNEHYQIVGLPLVPSIVRSTIQSNTFSPEAAEALECGDRDLFNQSSVKKFHFTTAMRLGVALWVEAWRRIDFKA